MSLIDGNKVTIAEVVEVLDACEFVTGQPHIVKVYPDGMVRVTKGV